MKKLFSIGLIALSLNTFAETDCEKIFDFLINNFQKDRQELIEKMYKEISECKNEHDAGYTGMNAWRFYHSIQLGFYSNIFHLVGKQQADKLMAEFEKNKDPEAAFATLRQKVKEACKSKR